MGYRYRLHAKHLPGRPDIVLPARRKAVLVHGCFWHRHGCANAVLPKARAPWWEAKLAGNVARDQRTMLALQAAGWQVIVVWECAIRADAQAVAASVAEFLGAPSDRGRGC